MAILPNSLDANKPHHGPDQPRSERDALLRAGATVFGYTLTEAVGDTVAFLTCARCGRTPATLQVVPGNRPVDLLLDLVVRCGRCGHAGHHIVTHRPATSAPPRVSPSSRPSIPPSSHPRARDHYIRARRTHAVHLTFPFHTQTTPDV
jgi:ribosomal protein L37E